MNTPLVKLPLTAQEVVFRYGTGTLGELGIDIYHVYFSRDPRHEAEYISKMALFHRRYRLGDKNVPFKSSDFNCWDDMERHIRTKLNAAVCLPVYMYDHSGLTISTRPFSCPWDSGQIGFIYFIKDEAKRIFGWKRLTRKGLAQLTRILEEEVQEYDFYLRGEVYGFALQDEDGTIQESCRGFYGLESVLREAAHTYNFIHTCQPCQP